MFLPKALIVMALTETEVAVLESIVIVRNEEHNGSAPGTTSSFEPTQPACEQPTQTWLQRNWSRIFGVVSKVAAITSLVLTALMAWPAITSSADTRRATKLAEWTSQKDYLEFCEAHGWKSDGCTLLKDAVLSPPPTRLTLLRRYLEGYPSHRGGYIHASPHDDTGHSVPIFPMPMYPDTLDSVSMADLALSTVVCFAGLLSLFFALRRASVAIRSLVAHLRGKHTLVCERRSVPRSGGDKMYLEHAKWKYYLDPHLFPTGEPSTATTGADLVTQESRANLRLRRLGRRGIKRKLRKTPRMYGSDSPDTSDDDLFITKKRDIKLPKRPRVGRIKHD
ncbi:hypothetical protein BR93DRAFT_532893 [Coniochaeta sp. PMI_546]|nr:hypothetical protein BR93DRAFT_532893 [Coniochaeta sp. PMI_546]